MTNIFSTILKSAPFVALGVITLSTSISGYAAVDTGLITKTSDYMNLRNSACVKVASIAPNVTVMPVEGPQIKCTVNGTVYMMTSVKTPAGSGYLASVFLTSTPVAKSVVTAPVSTFKTVDALNFRNSACGKISVIPNATALTAVTGTKLSCVVSGKSYPMTSVSYKGISGYVATEFIK